MLAEVTCPECDTTFKTPYGSNGLCPYCNDAYVSAPAHPATAA